MKRKLPENILITGASSGIGAAVAVECARRGAKTLFLCGRDAARLEAVAADCRAAGAAEVQAEIVDVTDEKATAAWIAACDARAPLGLVFANAGRGTGRESTENVRATFALNVGGVVNTVLPAIERFRARRAGGQIVITASIAGYAPLPGCPSYAATKAGGLRAFAPYRPQHVPHAVFHGSAQGRANHRRSRNPECGADRLPVADAAGGMGARPAALEAIGIRVFATT